jgi:hypothetical protein
MLASDIIVRAAHALFDETNVRWSKPELLRYITDGERQIVLLRPDAGSITATLTLVAGSKQSIPESTGIRFLRAIRNMGVAPNPDTPGRAIRECSRVALDNEMPDWHFVNPTTTIQHYVFDNIAPKTFYVYPPAQPNTKIEVVYSAVPPPVTAEGQQLSLTDQYINALLDWVLYRCYAKDASYAGNMQRAQAHLEAFGNSLQMTMQTEHMAAAAQAATPTPAAAAQARTGG